MLTRRPHALFYCFACFQIVFNHHRSINKSKRPIRDVYIDLTLICAGRHATACMRQHVDLNKKLVPLTLLLWRTDLAIITPSLRRTDLATITSNNKNGRKEREGKYPLAMGPIRTAREGLRARTTLDARQHRELYRKCS